MSSVPGACSVGALGGLALLAMNGNGFVTPLTKTNRVPDHTVSLGRTTNSAHSSSSIPVSINAIGGVCSLAAAAAFVSSRRQTSKTSTRGVSAWFDAQPCQQLKFKEPQPGSFKALQTMVGADVEMGDEPWDPMGFSKLYDRNFDFNGSMVWPHVKWLREAEIKHGRLCMLAFVGMVVQQYAQLPGYPAQPDWTKALADCYANQANALGIVQISVFQMFVEARFFPQGFWRGEGDREPGDFGFDPLGFTKKADFDLKTMQLKEIKNGRLAMIGVASLAANHAIPGSVPFLTGMYATKPESSTPSNVFCGDTFTSAMAAAPVSKTASKYTTQVILPSFTWIKTGVKNNDLAPTELRAKTIGGNDVLIGKDESGKLFCVANLCPHIGTPMSEGADVIGDVIVCPLHGSSFNTKTGDLIDWCPSPPIIGPLTGLVIEKKNIAVFDIRADFFGGELEVLVDTNAKKAYEANYWKGLLDAQGKDDGTYY